MAKGTEVQLGKGGRCASEQMQVSTEGIRERKKAGKRGNTQEGTEEGVKERKGIGHRRERADGKLGRLADAKFDVVILGLNLFHFQSMQPALSPPVASCEVTSAGVPPTLIYLAPPLLASTKGVRGLAEQTWKLQKAFWMRRAVRTQGKQ